MAGEINYALPTDILSAVAIEIGGAAPLVGLITRLHIRAHGTHQVLPYAAATGPVYGTYSVIRAAPGALAFSGVLVSTVATLQGILAGMDSVDYVTPTLLQITDPTTTSVLGAWNLWDYRLSGAQLSMHQMAHYTMIRGTFTATFRRMLVYTAP